MIRKSCKGYSALALALLVFSSSIAFSTYKTVREYELINKRFIPNLWVAAQAEIELLRFMNELHLYARSETASDSDDLVKRLYILWSRIPTLLGGSESEHVRSIDGAIATITNLDGTLERLEPAILSLPKGDLAAYQEIYRQLLPFQVPLHMIVASTMNKDEAVAAGQRDDIRDLYWWLLVYFVGMVASAVVLVLLLFREIAKVRGLLRTAHAAEAVASSARAQLSAVIDAVPARIAARDAAGRIIFQNRYRAERVAAGTPDQPSAADEGLDRRVFATGQAIPLFEEEEWPDAAAAPATWLTTKVPLKQGEAAVTGVVTVSLDISQQKEVQRQNTLLATAVEHAGDVIEITDSDGRFQYVNAAFERAVGYTRGEALGETPFSLLMGDQANEPYYRAVQECIIQGGIWQGTLTGRRKNGSVYQQETSISPVRSGGGAVTHFVAVKRDITERLEAEARIRHLAHHDALTGLPNRLLFQDRLQRAVAQAQRSGGGMALLLVDLDNFKDVNDAFGHDVGDLLLKHVTLRLAEASRETDTVARLGGDEFALIQTGLRDSTGAVCLAQKLVDRLAEPLVIEGQEIHISASVGITLCPLDTQEPDQLVKNADMAMYRAKLTGRNRYQFFQEDMNRAFRARKSLESDLRKALSENELELFYQPQVDAREGTVLGAEALVRWHHPQRGLVPPAEFIPIAEESGLILPLSDWVLRTACIQNRAWQQRGLPTIRVAVNLSAVQFMYRDLVDKVMAALDASGLSAECLELEITEGLLMRDTDLAVATLRRMNAAGISIAIDDFGTGYSSMSYLKRFPVSKVKIDRAFITEVTRDRGDAAIVNAVISLAHGLGLKVSAEGVETVDQMWHLCRQGCDEIQGYYFGRPMPAPEFAAYLCSPPHKSAVREAG